MLTNYGGEYPYRMTELYDAIGLNYGNYSRWVKMNLLDNFFEDADYTNSLFMMKSEFKAGKFRQEYHLTKRTAEELALISKTPQGKLLRRWLLDLKDSVENYDYLSLKQVYFLIDLVHAFSFVVNQKAAESAHKDKFINDYYNPDGRISVERICQRFHIMRNAALGISREEMNERVLRFWDEDGRLLNIDKQTRRDILAVISKFELIQHGAYDFMSSIGKPSEVALKVGSIVKEMATRMDVEMKQNNEEDLFSSSLDLNPAIMRNIEQHIPKTKKIKKA
jgi:phage anti-repressor protein